jgi:hypothetical protein
MSFIGDSEFEVFRLLTEGTTDPPFLLPEWTSFVRPIIQRRRRRVRRQPAPPAPIPVNISEIAPPLYPEVKCEERLEGSGTSVDPFIIED